VKGIRGNEPVGVVIHICREKTQGNSQCSYLYFKLAKMSYFSFLSSIFYKSENRKVEQVLWGREGFWYQCEGKRG
jgi:hypothetical protein